jgi:hypothetical protein
MLAPGMKYGAWNVAQIVPPKPDGQTHLVQPSRGFGKPPQRHFGTAFDGILLQISIWFKVTINLCLIPPNFTIISLLDCTKLCAKLIKFGVTVYPTLFDLIWDNLFDLIPSSILPIYLLSNQNYFLHHITWLLLSYLVWTLDKVLSVKSGDLRKVITIF